MIPKLIHYIWIGEKPMPNDVLKKIEICKKFNPDYIIKIWDNNNFTFSNNQYCKEAYESKKWAFVSDYIRLSVLYDYGGIYMDTDVEVVKNLDVLLKYKAFSGFESENRIPTGTMGAEPKNPWIKAILDYYDNTHFINSDGSFNLTTNVETITTITQSLYPIELNNSYQDLGDVVFLPFDWLCAKDLSTGKIKKTKNTLTIHHFAGSWLPLKEKVIKWMQNHYLGFGVKLVVKIKSIFRRKR